MSFKDLLHAVTDTKVGTVHMSSDDKQCRDRKVMVSLVSEPQSASLRIQTAFEGQKVSVYTPIQSEKWCQTLSKAGENIRHQ